MGAAMDRDKPVQNTSTWLKRIAFVSTGRADSGIYSPLVSALSGRYEVFFLAGGTHLSSVFGNSIRAIAAPAGARIVPVDHFVFGDDAHSVCKTAGRGIEAFSSALAETRPDLVFVLGDRTEMLAAALAVTIHGIPIAHLHGGDITAGAYDDACRHAITKLSHLHFAAAQEHGERLLSMGEEAWRTHVVGAPALDGVSAFCPASAVELSARLRLNFADGVMMLVYHPETLAEISPVQQIEAVLGGIKTWKRPILILGSNADVGHSEISGALHSLAESRADCRFVASLSQSDFWSCMTHAGILVGNSSAGLLEAPSFGLPVVNVGDRQRGRIRAANVIDVSCDAQSIKDGIAKAVGEEFKRSLAGLQNPYGDGRAASRIADILAQLPSRRELIIKHGSPGSR
jgi:UDP-hydrolysing UDP-N-acetyl-D-glucosamine 2-epimerase